MLRRDRVDPEVAAVATNGGVGLVAGACRQMKTLLAGDVIVGGVACAAIVAGVGVRGVEIFHARSVSWERDPGGTMPTASTRTRGGAARSIDGHGIGRAVLDLVAVHAGHLHRGALASLPLGLVNWLGDELEARGAEGDVLGRDHHFDTLAQALLLQHVDAVVAKRVVAGAPKERLAGGGAAPHALLGVAAAAAV